MGCKSMLLGGAMVLALAGTAGAQQTTPDTNTAPAATQSTPAQSSDTSTTESNSAPTTKHATHHARHHHARRHEHTAALHAPSTPAEKRQTFDLNRQQLQAADEAAAHPAGTPASYSQPQGAAPGMEPGNANMQPQTATPQNGASEAGPSYMSAPGANGPVGSAGNPTTGTDQKGPTPNTQPPSNPPGPSS